MATFYLDYVNGNDANDGTTFANRWKTITTGATAARIAPGDTIRIMKSGDPTVVGNATWTNGSNIVTLAAAVTKTVTTCDTAWTASANVTATASTTRREGADSASLAVAAAFTTGKIAYFTLASTDYSAYQRVTFWFRANAAVAATTLELRLCSDTTGTTAVDTFAIPAIPVAGSWFPLTIDKGSALGAAIQSVTLYAVADPGTVTILLDNIEAVKAVGAADALHLTALIGKNATGEAWYPILSIVGTQVALGGDNAITPATAIAYSGTTQTVTTYRRATIKTDFAATSTTAVETIQDSGDATNYITFSGGWDTTNMSTQTGDTFFDGSSGNGRAILSSSKSHLIFEHLAWCRYGSAMFLVGAGVNYQFNNCRFSACDISGYADTASFFFMKFSNCYAVRNATRGFDINSKNISGDTFYANENRNAGLRLNGAYTGSIVNVVCKGNTVYGVDNTDGVAVDIINLTTAQNGTAGMLNTGGAMNILNGSLSEATPVLSSDAFKGGYAYFHKYGGVATDHRIFTDGGLIQTETGANRHTASGLAWRLSPTSTNIQASYPLQLELAQVYCTSGRTMTVKAWMKRSSTSLTLQLVVPGNQLSGVTETTSSVSAGANTYQEQTITFTPSESGVLRIVARAYGGTTLDGYVDDMTFYEV